MSVIDKHQNDQWLQCHSVSWSRLLNICLNTDIYLYDLKMCMSRTRYSDILVYPTYYHVTSLFLVSDYCSQSLLLIYVYCSLYIVGLLCLLFFFCRISSWGRPLSWIKSLFSIRFCFSYLLTQSSLFTSFDGTVTYW